MKYEIEIGSEKHIAHVEQTDKGYEVRINDGDVRTIGCTQRTQKAIHLLYGARSIDVRQAFHDGEQEIHWEGRRIVGTVVDPRKKVLQLVGAAGGDVVVSQMPGRVLSISVSVGDTISKGDVVATVEAMKMENPLKAPRDGVVSEICTKEGALLEAKGTILRLVVE
jgi:biotin carboxyl carrier protein